MYALLQRRGVARWVSCLAVAPLLFDALVLTIEHHILVETVYIALLCGAVGIVLWRPRPTVGIAVASGGLLAAAWFVKPLALPLVVVIAGYLMLRRTGWRTWTGFLLAFTVGYLGVLIWVDGRASPYGASNIAFYSRVAGFAHCDSLVLTDAERTLCPAPDILGHRPDWYTWVSQSPGYPYRQSRSGDPILRDFAVAVASQQPGDYLRAVGRELSAHFVDGVDLGPEFDCLNGRYSMPADVRVEGGGDCHPQMAAPYFTVRQGRSEVPARADPADPSARDLLAGRAHPAAGRDRRLRAGPGGGGAAWPVAAGAGDGRVAGRAGRRRGPEALVADAVMLAVASLAIIVLPVLVGMYEPRYALPGAAVPGRGGRVRRPLAQPRPGPAPASDRYGDVPGRTGRGRGSRVVGGRVAAVAPADRPDLPDGPDDVRGSPEVPGARATNMRARWAFWSGVGHRWTGNRRRSRAGRTNAARIGSISG